MDARPQRALVGARKGRGASLPREIRPQLVWFTWLRVVVITTALFTTLMLDFVKLDRMADINTLPLYVVLAAAYVLSALDLVVQALVRSTSVVATVQFGGDIVVATALLHVLGYEGAVAFALALFSLTTFLACTYLTRVQGAFFATGAFLLQVVVHLATYFGLLPEETLTGMRSSQAIGPQELVQNLAIFMFTFYATAWLVGSRAERLRMIGDRLQSVTEDLHELRAFSDHVIQSLSVGLVTTDLKGRVTSANSGALHQLDTDLDDIAGRRLHEVLGWLPHEAADLDAAMADAAPGRFERDVVVDGRYRSFEVDISRILDRGGGMLGVLFLLEDVTDLRQLETEVRTKEKMAAIGEMAAGIAHEIRNPLASISGSVQMLQRNLELDGDQARLMQIVLKESSRLDSTIKEFLDFARPRHARPRLVDVAEIVRDTVLLLGNSDEVGEDHVLTAPAPGRVMAFVDPDQLRQVAWNLCQNAVRAMPKGGTMAATVVEEGDDVVISVEDTGVGMSPAAKQGAFQPLVGEFATGMGLGLAIVYRIVRDHGGRVAIESEEGRGTRVEVRLPIRIDASSPAVREAS